MSDTKLADLTALTTPSGDDLLYVVDDPAGTPSDKKLALDNLFTRGTVTTSSPVIDAAQTWNGAAINVTGASGTGTTATLTFAAQSVAFPLGSTITVASVNPTAYNGTFVVTASTTTSVSYASTASAAYVSGGTVQQLFTGLKFNATDTASAAASLLMDLQVGGASRFSVSKNGNLTLDNGSLSNKPGFLISSSPVGWYLGNFTQAPFIQGSGGGTGGITIRGDEGYYAFANSSGTSGTRDLLLTRRGAANLRFGAADAAAPVAQTLSVQSGTAGASALTVSISGTALTIAGAITGTIAIGHAVTGTGVSAGTLITAGSGTSWTVNNSQTVGPITAYFNSVGQNLTITGSQGSGPSAGGSIIFQVAPAGSAATTAQNALATALTIDSTRLSTFAGSAAFPAGSNSAPSIWFAGASTTGFFASFAGAISATVSGTNSFQIATTGIQVNSGMFIGFNSSSSISSATDTTIFRDAANTLALRNGTNAQAFRVYNTFTDASNYERFAVDWSSNVVRLGAQAEGSGSLRALRIGTFELGGGGQSTIGATVTVGVYSGKLQLYDINLQVGTATGTKIGTATNEKLGFWNATPVVQPTAVADATDAATVITQLNALLSRMRTIGLIAT